MLPVKDYRKNFLEGDLKRDEGLSTPEDIERMDDLSYGPYGENNLLDIYCQKGTQGVQPAIISVHGGAWVAGTKATYQYYCMSLAQRGFTVVNFNYRRAPETQFPGALEDINRLLGWILENGKDYHIDTDNLFLVGDSAGAQMASQYLAALDTMRYVNADFPPAYVVSSNRDFLRANALPMYEALKELGVESRVQIFGTEDAPKGHVFHLDIRDCEAAVCNDNECEFFRKFIQK